MVDASEKVIGETGETFAYELSVIHVDEVAPQLFDEMHEKDLHS